MQKPMPPSKPSQEKVKIMSKMSQVRAEQLHAAVLDALRELIALCPGSTTGYEAALNALGANVRENNGGEGSK